MNIYLRLSLIFFVISIIPVSILSFFYFENLGCMVGELSIKKNIMIFSILIYILSLITGLIILFIIIKRLGSIFNSMKKIGDGTFDIALNKQGRDNISEFTKAFDEMVQKFEKSFVKRDELLKEELRKDEVKEELRKTLLKLKQSNDDLEQFVYVASHDLQEPLRMVSSYTQLLNNKYSNNLDEKAKKYIFYANDGAKRIQILIQALLSFSKINSGGGDFEFLDLNLCLNYALKNLEKEISDKNAVIINNNLPKLSCDRDQIIIVFENIIGNSLKFSRKDNPQINISVVKDNNKYVFSISDNGIGIPIEHKDKIFVIFKRLHTRTEFPGSGAGLAICKKIIERHGGTIWFTSEIDKGTTFYFTLPNN